MYKINKKYKILVGIIFFILLISQFKLFLKIFYPNKYTELIQEYSQKYSIDENLIRSIINVESHYNKYAKSPKDACGLMQITISTGKWSAEKIGIFNYNEDMLYLPQINILIGCWYINNIKNELNLSESYDDTVILLAAYNGGIGNVKKWLQDQNYSQTGLKLDFIPFEETRNYVNKVLLNYKIYKILY